MKGVESAIKHSKDKIVEVLERVRADIPIKKSMRIFGFHWTTYYRWILDVKTACDGSYFEWCNHILPFQLSKPEVFKMKEMLTDVRFQYWSVYNIAQHALRNNILPLSISTWYKYVKLLDIQRLKPPHRRKKKKQGVRANAPNEIWHADVSLFKVEDMTYYIYVVMDNFSRKVLSWEVSTKLSKTIRFKTIKNAYYEAIEHFNVIDCALWVDGGSENNNKLVDHFIEQSQIGIHKVVALRDTTFSNSMVESIFRTMKHSYLYRMEINNFKDLKRSLQFTFKDYNEHRPHYGLVGATPYEVYNGDLSNRRDNTLFLTQAKNKRLAYNRANECGKCLQL